MLARGELDYTKAQFGCQVGTIGRKKSRPAVKLERAKSVQLDEFDCRERRHPCLPALVNKSLTKAQRQGCLRAQGFERGELYVKRSNAKH
jgi:hypothetical protein